MLWQCFSRFSVDGGEKSQPGGGLGLSRLARPIEPSSATKAQMTMFTILHAPGSGHHCPGVKEGMLIG